MVLPGLSDLRGYQRAWLRHDLLAGLTVAAYLIPQVMAYAGLAGLPPVTDALRAELTRCGVVFALARVKQDLLAA